MHEPGCSGLVHQDDPKGWDGEGGRRGGSGWGTHVHPWLIQCMAMVVICLAYVICMTTIRGYQCMAKTTTIL